jgi:predicted O-methyltransferase YrrM
MKELYEDIERWLDNNPHGWASKEKVAAMVGAVLALRPKLVVEIGVWTGRSLIPMAMALKYITSEGCVLGIDPWSNAASSEGMSGPNLEFWGGANHQAFYELFIQSIEAVGVQPWVQTRRCRSDEFELDSQGLAATGPIDILHVDGNHGEEASIYDVLHFAPRVRMGGLFFMDDVEWAERATKRIPELGFSQLYALDTGLMFQRTRMESPG